METTLINVRTGGLQHQPALARFAASRFVAAWTHADRAIICARILGADGQPASDELTCNGPDPADVLRHHPALATLATGFAAAWLEEGRTPGGPRPHVKLQRFDDSGRKLGAEFQVSTDEVDNSQAPSLSALIDGGFVVTWVGSRADRRIVAQRFSPDGAPRGAPIVASTIEGFHEQPLVIRFENGNFALTWTHDPVAPGGGNAQLRVFDHQGQPVSDLLALDFAGAQALALLDDGGRCVAAHIRRGVPSGIGVESNSVRAQVLNADGSLAGLPLFISSARGVNCTSPALAGLPGRRFVACWLQKSAETFDTTTHLRAQVFSAEGERLGAEVQVDAASGGNRFQARVAALFAGDAGEALGFAWDDSAGTAAATDFDVRGAVLRPDAGGGFAA